IRTTRNYSPSSRHSVSGDTTWKVLPFLSTLSQITRTLNISAPRKSSLADRHAGQSIYLSSTLLYVSDPVDSVRNLTLSLDDGTSTEKGGIVTTPRLILTISDLSFPKSSFELHSWQPVFTPHLFAPPSL